MRNKKPFIIVLIALLAAILVIVFIRFIPRTNAPQKYTFEHKISLQPVDKNISDLYYAKHNSLDNMILFKPDNSNFCIQVPKDASIYAGEHNDKDISAYTYRITFDDNYISIMDTYRYSDNIPKPASIEDLVEYQKQEGVTLSGNLGNFEILTENDEYIGYSYCQYIGDYYKSYNKVYIDNNRIIGINVQNDNDVNTEQCFSSFVLLSQLQ